MNQIQQIREILQCHKGQDNPITSSRIGFFTRLEPRTIRKIIHELRLEGELICSDGDGYYLPETVEEARRSMATFSARFKAMNETCKRLEASITERFGEQQGKLNLGA